MPASSRKRNKGRDRKAKQLAKKEENERESARVFWRSFCSTSVECNHGCDVILEDRLISTYDHPISCFMDQFIMNLHYTETSLPDNMKDMFEKHPQIWKDESCRNTAINIFIHIGTNLLLRRYCNAFYNTLCIAKSILVLEHYNGTGNIESVINERVVSLKSRDLRGGNCMRDLLKFYRKRTTCKCLKKMHLEARRTLQKIGICWHCNGERTRAALSVCGRCMVEQYCSRDCQIAAWPEHKGHCDILSSALEKEMSNGDE